MRLTCPNCGAQYEVPDEVIPEAGRDVQCSNCGHTWFQAHPDHPHAAAEPEEPDYRDDDRHDWADPPEQDTTAGPARRELDADITSVLREEAAREAEARAAEARGGLETQPELGLSDPGEEAGRRSDQARARMARLRGMAAPDEAAENDEIDIDPGSRRGLLPDIEEINSTIATEAAPGQQDLSARDGSKVAAQPAPRGGFGRGVRLAVALAIVATALYMFAPQIGATVPQLAPPLAAYVDAVNQGRVLLDEQVAQAAAQIRALTGG